MSGDYLWDGSGPPEPEVVRLEQALGRFRHRGRVPEPPELRWGPGRHGPRRALLVALAAVLLALAVLVVSRDAPPEGCELVVLDGAPAVGGVAHGPNGSVPLEPGDALSCDAGSRARIRVGELGTVDVAPGARVTVRSAGDLPGSADARYLLSLERGLVRATIFAAPREFQVGTPAGLAVDLGCVYEAEVAPDGGTRLRVEHGVVSFETERRRVLVPERAYVLADPVRGPGTPVWSDAPAKYRDAARALDDGVGDPAAHLDVLLATRDERDSLTLWHLLASGSPVADEAQRARVHARLSKIAPAPSERTRDEALAGDADALRRWRDSLSWYWGAPKKP